MSTLLYPSPLLNRNKSLLNYAMARRVHDKPFRHSFVGATTVSKPPSHWTAASICSQVCHALFDRSWTPNTTVLDVLSCVYGKLPRDAGGCEARPTKQASRGQPEQIRQNWAVVLSAAASLTAEKGRKRKMVDFE